MNIVKGYETTQIDINKLSVKCLTSNAYDYMQKVNVVSCSQVGEDLILEGTYKDTNKPCTIKPGPNIIISLS